jgi:hypothetical protein
MNSPILTTRRLGLIRTLSFLLLVSSVAVYGQIQSITTTAIYGVGLSKRLNVESASAIGGGVEVTLKLSGSYSIGLQAGYASYSISQTDQLNNWNWNFWNDRYYPKIQSDMRADQNLSAQIGSVQAMDEIPVMLVVHYHAPAGERLGIVPCVGAGLSFFNRKLYADETWTKQFPQTQYTLTYNLRNFAPPKKGNALVLALGCDATYRIGGDVNIIAGAHYRSYLSATSGFEEFPLASGFNIKLGLNFLY